MRKTPQAAAIRKTLPLRASSELEPIKKWGYQMKQKMHT